MSPTAIAYAYLAGAIIFEITGTTFLVKSQEFTKLYPTLATVVLYAFSFYFLTKSLRGIPLGIAYAMWGGIGIVLTALIGLLVFKQSIDTPAVIGIGLIVTGVVVLNLFSSSVG
ncbi:QacE family quaternary ammonium compound efflux SMR transporter [Psychrobacter sp. YP14]|uniref:DMT family transporter n=1 Tax=Psychrobacter TaxID=497 RepID=UPI000D7D725A|nr:multidrug efflux SMR transporter [Psychrobacter sp. YP14]AWT48676.1 QacE family quaternary ammonium compound efflux SMR transporter [Psychrobacter sp. YP14]